MLEVKDNKIRAGIPNIKYRTPRRTVKKIPNIISFSRIAAAFSMAFIAPNSLVFWGLYAWSGLSDMVDGAIARKLGVQSAQGARLDSIADLVFVFVCFVKLLPLFSLPTWLVVWIALIALCKLASYILGFAAQKRLVALHTPANKATGALIFLSVPAVLLSGSILLALPACALATFAAIQENRQIRLCHATR